MIKILVVEDNRIFREAFKEKLIRRFPDLKMEEAVSGEEALQNLEREPADLVITDMHLPGMNGFNLSRNIKKVFPNITVVIVTGYDLPEYREAARQFGADAFWGKETLEWEEVEQLIAKIEQGPGPLRSNPES